MNKTLGHNLSLRGKRLRVYKKKEKKEIRGNFRFLDKFGMKLSSCHVY